jgi:hypothetical protein
LEGAVGKLAVVSFFGSPTVGWFASLARKIWFSSSRLATTRSIAPSLSRSATTTLVVGESTSKAVPPIGVAVRKSPDVGEP